jgi:hypothetical protein
MSLGAKIAVGGVGVAIVGVLGWALWWEPRQKREVAKAQIVEWEKDWGQVRRCVAGDAPLSQDRAENLALLALTDFEARTKLERCRVLISRLRPAAGEDSGVQAIEDGWKKAADAVAVLNASIADYAADVPSKPLADIRADIVARLDEVDAAYDGLRKAAGLPPVAWPSGGAPPAPPMPEGAVVRVGGNQVVAPDQVVVIGGALVVRGRTGGGPYLVLVTGPGAQRELPLNTEGMAQAVALESPWAVAVRGEGKQVLVEAVALDSAGERDATRKPALVARLPLPDEDTGGGDVIVATAVGAGKDRAVVYEVSHVDDEGSDTFLARSRDGGATWRVERVATVGVAGVYEDWVHGRVEVLFEKDDLDGRLLAWLPLDAATLAGSPELHLLPFSTSVGPCPAKDHVWFAGTSSIARVPAHGGAPDLQLERPPGSEQVSCVDDAVAATGFGVDDLTVIACTTERCTIEGRMPWGPGASVAATPVAGGGVVAATLAEGYLLAWTKGENGVLAPRPAYRVPGDVRLVGVVDWGGALHAVLAGEQVTLVPLPK